MKKILINVSFDIKTLLALVMRETCILYPKPSHVEK